MLTYLKVFVDWRDTTAELTLEEKGRLIDAMVAYLRGDEPVLSGNERILFPAFKAQIDRNQQAYAARVSKCREAGAIGGKQKAANASNRKQMLADASESSEEKEEENKNKRIRGGAGGDPAPKRKRFTPPTLEELKQYIREKGYSIDAQRFLDHYESVGWKVGRNPMKDWRAAVRTWTSWEQSTPKQPVCVEHDVANLDTLYS